MVWWDMYQTDVDLDLVHWFIFTSFQICVCFWHLSWFFSFIPKQLNVHFITFGSHISIFTYFLFSLHHLPQLTISKRHCYLFSWCEWICNLFFISILTFSCWDHGDMIIMLAWTHVWFCVYATNLYICDYWKNSSMKLTNTETILWRPTQTETPRRP